MVVEMENFKAIQYGRTGVIRELDTYQESTREVLKSIRSVLFDLRDESGTELDFISELRISLDRYQARYGIVTKLWVMRGWPRQLASHAATQLSRIVDEALNNVRLHSGASRVSVRLSMRAGDIAILTVRDNGRGIDAWGSRRGMGMLGMRERALLLGGELQIVRGSGSGTLLKAAFPRENLT
jgi:signal transduction histidine kinase